MIDKQAGLVPVRNAVEEDRAAALPLHSIVVRVCLGVRTVRKAIAPDPFLVDRLEEQVREVFVERRTCPTGYWSFTSSRSTVPTGTCG